MSSTSDDRRQALSASRGGPDADRAGERARRWTSAWPGNDPDVLADLFAQDAEYTDHAFEVTSRGRAAIARWKSRTDRDIEALAVEVSGAFGSASSVAIEWTFTGRLTGARSPFAVPAMTVQHLDPDGLIVLNGDYYNRAAVLRQSGLPADWSPPHG